MTEHRWPARPRTAAALRPAVLLLPLLAAIGAGLLTVQLLGDSPARLPVALAVTTVVLVLLELAARRLLPLELLLRLSLLFPDRAPNRFRLALRAGSTRELSLAAGTASPEAAAAHQVLALLARTARHDRLTRRHAERVRAYVDLLAEALHLPPGDVERLRWAALIHDIGKVEVAPGVLNKPGRLDEDEWQQVRRHPADGARIAAGLRPFLGPWFDAIGQHHERWDGRGYPRGLAGEQISYGARIVAVADAFEVMTAPRSYKRAADLADARAELVACGGSQFDPDVVRAMVGISLERLHRVLGPVAWLGVLPSAGRGAEPSVDAPGAEPSLSDQVLAQVGLHPAARLAAGATPHTAAAATGSDAGGGGHPAGQGGAGQQHASTGADPR